MKCTAFPMLLLFVACAPVTPIEELERKALETGDWSQVDRRQRVDLSRRKHRTSVRIECGEGQVAFCEQYGLKEECRCVARHAAIVSIRLH